MKAIKKYLWLFYWIACAVFIAFSIVILINKEFFIYLVGAFFGVIGLGRVIPFIKTSDSKIVKWFAFLEMLIYIAICVLLFLYSDEVNEKSELIGYLVGGGIYLRGFMHFFSISLRSEKTSIKKFLINVALITFATVIIAKGGFSVNTASYCVVSICGICFVILFIIGLFKYLDFRKKKQISEEKKYPTNYDEFIMEVPTVQEENK